MAADAANHVFNANDITPLQIHRIALQDKRSHRSKRANCTCIYGARNIGCNPSFSRLQQYKIEVAPRVFKEVQMKPVLWHHIGAVEALQVLDPLKHVR